MPESLLVREGRENLFAKINSITLAIHWANETIDGGNYDYFLLNLPRMKHISILIPAGDTVVGSIEGAHKVFGQANDLLIRMGRPPIFCVELVGWRQEVSLNEGHFTLRADRTIAQDFHTDLVIVPAPRGDLQTAVAQNEEVIAWITRQYAAGAEVASLCVGAFLLAATGLLNGLPCATHWFAAHEFRIMYPAVELIDDRIVTDTKGLYTSGGAYSHLNLILYLIEKYSDRHLAVLCAKIFQIDIARDSQASFSMFQGLKKHSDELILRAQAFIEAHVQQKITVEELAELCFLGRRHFERRFRKATLNSVLEYVQRVKIEAAKQRLESSNDSINEVMYAVGYSDSKSFRSLFKALTGLSPLEYRTKFWGYTANVEQLT